MGWLDEVSAGVGSRTWLVVQGAIHATRQKISVFAARPAFQRTQTVMPFDNSSLAESIDGGTGNSSGAREGQ